jgi:hypothetical protein
VWGGGKNFPIFLSSIGYEYIRWPKVGGSDVLARDKSFLGPTFLFLIPSLRGGGARNKKVRALEGFWNIKFSWLA